MKKSRIGVGIAILLSLFWGTCYLLNTHYGIQDFALSVFPGTQLSTSGVSAEPRQGRTVKVTVNAVNPNPNTNPIDLVLVMVPNLNPFSDTQKMRVSWFGTSTQSLAGPSLEVVRDVELAPSVRKIEILQGDSVVSSCDLPSP